MTTKPVSPTAPDRVPDARNVEVLVVGGGPVGMTLAGDLARAGRDVTVLERWPQPNPASRAFAVMPRTLEVLDARGLADGLLPLGHRAGSVNLFGDMQLDLTRAPSAYRFALITPQTNVDAALTRYAEQEGATVLRGVEVTGLQQDADGVTVTAEPKGGGAQSLWRAAYVVGADGAHSTVRDLAGSPFPGRTVLSSVVLADVRLLHGPSDGGLTLGSTPDVFGFLVPYRRPDAAAAGADPSAPGRWYRSMTWDRHHQLPDTAPVADGEIADVLGRAMAADLGLAEVGWHSRFHCEERQVPNYRLGRVFLAGDAAHVHSPVGGQGMNTGIQDAANLGWKLDAVLGGAADAVLDSYQRERHPIGAQVVSQSGLMMRAVILKPRLARRIRDAVAPRLMSGRFGDVVVGRFTGTALRYGHRRGEHPLVGTRASEVPLRGRRLSELQRELDFVLVREAGRPAQPADIGQAERTDDGPALLVRPDGYIAWAGSLGEPGEDSGWRAALAHWTGSASDGSAAVTEAVRARH